MNNAATPSPYRSFLVFWGAFSGTHSQALRAFAAMRGESVRECTRRLQDSRLLAEEAKR